MIAASQRRSGPDASFEVAFVTRSSPLARRRPRSPRSSRKPSRHGCRRCRSTCRCRRPIAGSGSVSAVLTGTKLAVTGTFDGLRVAGDDRADPQESDQRRARPGRLRPRRREDRRRRAARISGTLDLTPHSVADLEKGRLYVQLHSEKAPDGNSVGLAAAAGEQDDEAFTARADARWRRRRVALRRSRSSAGQQPPAAGLHRRAGGRRPHGLSGELRELPHARPRAAATKRRSSPATTS